MFYLYLWIAAQIIIEMLPISSSGHLLLLELLLKQYAACDIKKYFGNASILKSLYYFLHGPTLIIVCGCFFWRWWQLVLNVNGIAWNLMFCLVIADGITCLMYLASGFLRNPFASMEPVGRMEKLIKLINHKKTTIAISLGLGFIITAIALFYTAWCSGGKTISLISYTDAAILGVVQGLALFPGISRLAFTCSMGCLLGFSLPDAFFLSWTMQAPLMAAAFAKSLKDLYELGALTQVLNLPMSLVMLGSSGISVLVMVIIMQMAQNNTWYLFGWYMGVPMLIWVFFDRKK